MNELSTATTLPANMADRMAALRQKAAQEIKLWQPQPGDALIGELFAKREIATQYGLNEQFILRDETGKLHAYWLTDWIEKNLRAQGATYGCLVALTFEGKHPKKSGGEYNMFSLMVEK